MVTIEKFEVLEENTIRFNFSDERVKALRRKFLILKRKYNQQVN